jgi:hypothetical protein
MCYRTEIMEAPKRDCVYDAAYTWSKTQCTSLPMGNECCECKNIQSPMGKSDGKGSKDSKGMKGSKSKAGSKDGKGMKGSKQAKGSNDKKDSKSAKGPKDALKDPKSAAKGSKSSKGSKDAQKDSKSAKASKGAQDQDQTQSKGAKEGEQGEDDSTTAKGKEGKKSYSHGNKAPGLALEEEVETEMANDSMNWMEIVAASAIGIVVTALVIALVMRTKQKSAANQMEMEMGAVTHVADMSTSQATAEVSA